MQISICYLMKGAYNKMEKINDKEAMILNSLKTWMVLSAVTAMFSLVAAGGLSYDCAAFLAARPVDVQILAQVGCDALTGNPVTIPEAILSGFSFLALP